MEIKFSDADLELFSRSIADKIISKINENPTGSLLDVDQLAAFLNVPKSWIYDRTRDRRDGIPHIKAGKYLRFYPTEVINWLRQRADQEV
jgi:predicted DNA-binding transcriptional regulator AlpA